MNKSIMFFLIGVGILTLLLIFEVTVPRNTGLADAQTCRNCGRHMQRKDYSRYNWPPQERQLRPNYSDPSLSAPSNMPIQKPSGFECPASGYVDCMPTVGTKNTQCNPQFIDWAKKNCEDFKGVAY